MGFHRLLSKALLVIVLASLWVFSACSFPAGKGDAHPRPLGRTAPGGDPYIYGTGGSIYDFAAVGGNVLDVRRRTGPIVDYLGHRLGVRFRLAYYRRYQDIVAALVEGKAHFAWLGPTTYLAVRRRLPCVPVVQILRDGVGYYEGVILVRLDRGYTSIDDLKGRVLAFIDRSSTSGFIYPMHYFKARGIDPRTFFGRIEFAGGHSNALFRLVNGTYDAVCTERDILKRMAGKVDTALLQVLAVTGRIPNGPIAAHPALPRTFIRKAARVLVTMSADPDGAELLSELRDTSNFTGFGPVSEATFDEVSRVVEEARACPSFRDDGTDGAVGAGGRPAGGKRKR